MLSFGINDICPGYLGIFTGEFRRKFVERVNRGCRGGGQGVLRLDCLADEHGDVLGRGTLSLALRPETLLRLMNEVARTKYRDTRLLDEQVNCGGTGQASAPISAGREDGYPVTCDGHCRHLPNRGQMWDTAVNLLLGTSSASVLSLCARRRSLFDQLTYRSSDTFDDIDD